MIVNAAISRDVLSVFQELFAAEYEIQSMRLIDDYWTGDGDSSDSNSIDNNNTSAFCYRQITGGEICQIMPTDGPLTLIHSRTLMYGTPRGSFSGAMKMRLPMLTAPAEILM